MNNSWVGAVGLVLVVAGCAATGKGNPDTAVAAAPAATSSATASATSTASTTAIPTATSTATSTASRFPGTAAGARALLLEFLKPGADCAALTKTLRPNGADYAAIFVGSAASAAEGAYAPQWASPDMVLAPKAGQTELLLFQATTEELRSWTGDAREFPGGYRKIGAKLQPGLTFYRFEFVAPGTTSGMAFDGLVFANGRWVVVPKPWRAVGG